MSGFIFKVDPDIISGIYIIKNSLNCKAYIGSTSNLRKRFCSHRAALKNKKHHSVHFQRFYNKYEENVTFTFEVLEEENDFAELIKKEQKWLDGLRTYDRKKGFNICKKADSTRGVRRSEKSIKKMKSTWSEKYGGHPCLGKESPLIGSTLSEETKRKISKANSGDKNGNFRREYTLQEREAISKRSSKPIVETDADGRIINEFSSASEASAVLKLDASNINRVCNGIFHSYKNRYFKFKDKSIRPEPKKKTTNKTISVRCDNIEIYKSNNRRDIAKFLNISYDYLKSIISKNNHKKYTFIFLD